jgi:hypothetical protein
MSNAITRKTELDDIMYYDVGTVIAAYPGPTTVFTVHRVTARSMTTGRMFSGFAVYARSMDDPENTQHWVADFPTYREARILARESSEVL